MFKDVSLSFDNQLCLVAQDGLGVQRFRIPLTEQGARKNVANASVYNNQAPTYVGVNGGLLLVTRGNQLMAVDTLRKGGVDNSSANRVLWTHDLNEQIGGFASNQSIISRSVPLPWGGNRTVSEDSMSRRLASLGPINDDGIYFQRLHDLHCVDPLTGKTLWTRKNVGLGNDLFGDDELLFVAPPADGETLVLRAATGELLRQAPGGALQSPRDHARPLDAHLGSERARVRAGNARHVGRRRDLVSHAGVGLEGGGGLR